MPNLPSFGRTKTHGVAPAEGSGESIVQRPPNHIDQLIIPAHCLETTLEGLALGRDREMVAYWIGTPVAAPEASIATAVVTTVAFPRIESSDNHFRVVDGQMGLVSTWCAERGLWVLAQVHTHPTDEPHSEADECWPLSHRPGFLSVIIPFFAQFSTIAYPHWRAYELIGSGKWNEVNPDERFTVVSDVWLPRS